MALRISGGTPAIIYVDVFISKTLQIELNKLVCNLFDMIGGDSRTTEIIPCVVPEAGSSMGNCDTWHESGRLSIPHRGGQTHAIVDGGNKDRQMQHKPTSNHDLHAHHT
jgi:hypothetical protein